MIMARQMFEIIVIFFFFSLFLFPLLKEAPSKDVVD